MQRQAERDGQKEQYFKALTNHVLRPQAGLCGGDKQPLIPTSSDPTTLPVPISGGGVITFIVSGMPEVALLGGKMTAPTHLLQVSMNDGLAEVTRVLSSTSFTGMELEATPALAYATGGSGCSAMRCVPPTHRCK